MAVHLCTVCMHVHRVIRCKTYCADTGEKNLSLAQNNAWVLNNAQTQNNAPFWMLTNVSAQGVITGFYGISSTLASTGKDHIRQHIANTRYPSGAEISAYSVQNQTGDEAATPRAVR